MVSRLILLLTILSFALSLENLNAYPGQDSSQEIRYNVLKKFFDTNGEKLYDLDYVAESAEYKAAKTDEEREAVYVKKFEEKKQYDLRNLFLGNVFNYLGVIAAITVVWVGTAGLYWWWAGRPNMEKELKDKNKTPREKKAYETAQKLKTEKKLKRERDERIEKELHSELFKAVIPPSIYNMFAAGFSFQFVALSFPEADPMYWIKNLVYSTTFAWDPLTADVKKIHQLELDFVKKYELIKRNHPDLLVQMKKLLVRLWKVAIETLSFDNVDVKNAELWMKQAETIPFGKVKLKFCTEFFDEYFGNYPADIRTGLKEYIEKQIIFSDAKSKVKRFYPLYLIGPPGTGKTHAVQGLAKCIGVPMISMNITGMNSEADLYGDANGTPGRILEAYGIHKKSNPGVIPENSILFIDEFDRAIQTRTWDGRLEPNSHVIGVLLKFLEPTSGGDFLSPFLGVKVTTPKIIILAGNFKPQDEALQSRLEFIEFPPFSERDKEKLVKEKLLKKLSEEHDLDPKDLHPEEMAQVDQVIQKNLGDPGLRKMELDLDNLFIRILTRRATEALKLAAQADATPH